MVVFFVRVSSDDFDEDLTIYNDTWPGNLPWGGGMEELGLVSAEGAPREARNFRFFFDEIPQDFVGTITVEARYSYWWLPEYFEPPAPVFSSAQIGEPPTTDPTAEPTTDPTAEPTTDPTAEPTTDPTAEPTSEPSSEAPVERRLVIDPEEVTAADFVSEDAGVTIAAAGFSEGETVTLVVSAGPGGVEGVTLTEVADDDGVAAFVVYGTNDSQPSVYVGSYEVEVTGSEDAADDEDPLTGSFDVVSGASSGSGEAGGSTSNSLPRTGAELGGLGLGVALLIAGAIAIMASRRRAKALSD